MPRRLPDRLPWQTPAPTADDAATWSAAQLPVSAAEVTPAEVDAADIAVNGPQARADNDVTGAEIKIGILSDSFNLLGGEASDIAEGLLPPAADIHILEEGPSGSTDEGRAMAQIVHATAPGAQIYFYTAFNSEADFAAGITALQNAGCQIIVDDTTYPDEPMFQVTGALDTAIEQAVAGGVDYFTAAGNEDSSFYQAIFVPVSLSIRGLGTVTALPFSNGSGLQSVNIPSEYSVTLALDWDAPYDADNADSITVEALLNNRVVASSTQVGTAPVVELDFPQVSVNRNYSIAILQNAGTPTPTLIKYVLEGGGTINDPASGIGSGSAIGHALVPGINVVGAVDVTDTPAEGGTPTPESFSGTGPGEILFEPDGHQLPVPEVPDIPSFVAPDGADTSVLDPFFGTSAAAPVAAATAALMLQAQPALDTADVTFLLADSAIPAGAASVAGAGLIQANLAVSYAATGVISGSQQTDIFGTSLGGTIVGGAGTHDIIAGTGNTLIESQGTDSVQAGAGADTVDLTGAAAELLGGSGSLLVPKLDGTDTVVGGTGSVSVTGGTGGGQEYGGSEGDNLLVAGLQATTIVAGGPGDTLQAAGSAGDLLTANSTGAATLTAGQSSGGNTFVLNGTGQLVQTGTGGNMVVVNGNDDAVVTGGSALTLGDGTSVTFATLVQLGTPHQFG